MHLGPDLVQDASRACSRQALEYGWPLQRQLQLYRVLVGGQSDLVAGHSCLVVLVACQSDLVLVAGQSDLVGGHSCLLVLVAGQSDLVLVSGQSL